MNAVTTVELAEMRERHLRGVVAIEAATNHRPWSKKLFSDELKLPEERRVYYVALDGPEVVGFAGAMLTGFEAHITNVAVAPARQRQGIAARLVVQLLDEIARRGVDDVTLEVRMSNAAAQELYRRCGFAPGGVRPGYYQEIGEDALIMWAHDISSQPMIERRNGMVSR